MAAENATWGAPGIHGELLKLGFDVSERSVSRWMNRRRILELARAGKLPGHPIGDGARRVWRFRLSELAATVAKNVFSSQNDHGIRNPLGTLRRTAPGAVDGEVSTRQFTNRESQAGTDLGAEALRDATVGR
ncbi:MAG TPA: hypothetical protein VMH03_05860 [Terriglobales bacterium]|nr:hypothetical protein [Terriglobales bacterium]